MDLQITVTLIAAGAALGGALLGALAGWWSTAYAQRHQDLLAAMTAPLQRGSGGAWTPDQDMTEEDRRRFYKTLESLRRASRTRPST
jgi:hypothetical protein